jgi:alcohol dehydrogenase
VAVHGCGGVGLSAVMIAAACGARVVAVDVSPAALDLARTLGAEAVLDGGARTGGEDPADGPAGEPGDGPGRVAEAIRQITGGGAHVSLDALGSPATCAASIGCLRRRGRHVQVGLLPPLDAQGADRLPMDRVIAYELAVLGSHGMPAHAYGPMMDLVATGRLRPDRLITETIGLAETPAALSAMGTGPAAGVTIIEP